MLSNLLYSITAILLVPHHHVIGANISFSNVHVAYGFEGTGTGTGTVENRGSCRQGNYYKHPDFFSEVTNDFINENPNSFITASQHCVAAFLNFTLLAEICACDCYKTHGASDSEVCVIDMDDLKEAPVGCVCLYSKEDMRGLPCLANGTGKGRPKNLSTKSRDPELERAIGMSRVNQCKKVAAVKERNSCLDNVCQPLSETVKTLACTEETIKIRNHNGTIQGSDMCSIDCFYVHGSRTEPYGICTRLGGKTACTCLY